MNIDNLQEFGYVTDDSGYVTNETTDKIKEINEKKSEQTVTKKSLLKELFLLDKDDDKRKPLNLDCLELKPEFAIKYKRPE